MSTILQASERKEKSREKGGGGVVLDMGQHIQCGERKKTSEVTGAGGGGCRTWIPVCEEASSERGRGK